MKFKIDENLPVEFAELLTSAAHDAVTVLTQGLQGTDDPTLADVCVQEDRILVTLDLDFADIRSYPPQDFPGFIVLRVGRHDKRHLMAVFQRAISLMDQEPLARRLWIVEEIRVRIRGGED